MKLPWLCICGGVTGDLRRARAVAQQPEFVLRHRHADRRRILAPARAAARSSGSRLDHRAGQDLRADRRGLLDHADADVGLELLQADRERQPGRPGADGDDVVFHDVAFAHAGSGRIGMAAIFADSARARQCASVAGSAVNRVRDVAAPIFAAVRIRAARMHRDHGEHQAVARIEIAAQAAECRRSFGHFDFVSGLGRRRDRRSVCSTRPTRARN